MHAIVFFGNNPDALEKEIGKLTGRLIEIEVQKIEQVRELRGMIKYKFSEPVTVLMRDVDKASVEAQNALLKSIEEPAQGVIFAATAVREDSVLPTILSRCVVVHLPAKVSDYQDFVDDFLKMSQDARIGAISKIKTREQAVDFLTKMVSEGHKKIQEGEQYLKIAEEGEWTLQAINANCNVQLQLTSYVVKISV